MSFNEGEAKHASTTSAKRYLSSMHTRTHRRTSTNDELIATWIHDVWSFGPFAKIFTNEKSVRRWTFKLITAERENEQPVDVCGLQWNEIKYYLLAGRWMSGARRYVFYDHVRNYQQQKSNSHSDVVTLKDRTHTHWPPSSQRASAVCGSIDEVTQF